MIVSELNELINGKLLSKGGADNNVTCGYVCDLLSWVMAKGCADCAWVTVQTHMNVIAVASLHDMACVICPEGIIMEEASVEKADEEGIAIITSPMPAYKIAGLLYEKGVLPANAD